MVSTPPVKILWLQVIGLGTVQGAIALTWVIYNLYLGKLLTQFGFPPTLTTAVLVVENLLGMVMEPLMGSLSDQTQQKVGSRLPFIVLGVVLASGCFIAIPAIALWGPTTTVWRWLLPGMAIAWALAMTVFRSPALSLLGRYAYVPQLPQAASVLTLMGATVGAIAVPVQSWILSLGPVVTFSIGSLSLLGAATVLRTVQPQAQVQGVGPEAHGFRSLNSAIAALGVIFGLGIGIGLGFRLLMLLMTKGLSHLPAINTNLVLSSFSLALVVAALPAGTLAQRWGNKLAMLLGLGAMICCWGLMLLATQTLMAQMLAIAIAAAFSLVANGTIPFALALVPPQRAGLGTGMYFGGAALANSLFGAWFGQAQAIAPLNGTLIGIVALLMAAGCVVASEMAGPRRAIA